MRLFPPIVLALSLFSFLIFLLFPRGAPTTAHAQSVAGTTITTTHTSTTTTAAAAAAHSLYLPLIHRGPDNPPTPTPSPTPLSIKAKSGIHLGNRGSSDWRAELFTLITGTVTGTWPAAVVIQSDQVYNLYRYSTAECRIAAAGLKLTGAGEPYNVYQYLTAAAKAGTQVMIRITPSPGNFVDYADPGDNHTLLNREVPAGGDYCGNANKHFSYRDVRDIAEEMNAIYAVNIQHGWPVASFFFEPANEPNYEWYQALREQGKVIDPHVDNKDAWIQMDDYFAALYERAKALNPELQVLLPSMAQGLYGEHYGLGTCDPIEVVGDGLGRSGLDLMKKSFGYDIGVDPPQITEPKADGFAWHNYWREGREAWLPPFDLPQSPPTVDDYCVISEDYEPQTDHLYQYLSAGMQQNMSALPTFITEADLLSPCQLEVFSDTSRKDDAAAETRDSLVRFIEEEYQQGYGARYVIAWLLVNQYEDEEPSCQNAAGENNHNYEINWHEAYPETGDAHQWFQLWWPETP